MFRHIRMLMSMTYPLRKLPVFSGYVWENQSDFHGIYILLVEGRQVDMIPTEKRTGIWRFWGYFGPWLQTSIAGSGLLTCSVWRSPLMLPDCYAAPSTPKTHFLQGMTSTLY